MLAAAWYVEERERALLQMFIGILLVFCWRFCVRVVKIHWQCKQLPKITINRGLLHVIFFVNAYTLSVDELSNEYCGQNQQFQGFLFTFISLAVAASDIGLHC